MNKEINVVSKLKDDYFKNPPKEFSPIAFWFWNGEIKNEEVSRQIDEMIDKGVYGGFMHARKALTTPYLKEEWWKVVEHTVKYSEKVGFNPWIYDEYAWPSGAAGSTDKNCNQTYSKVLAEGEKNNGKGLDYIIKNVDKSQILDINNIKKTSGLQAYSMDVKVL